MSASGVVFDIKKYAIQDGPGLRTSVHLKGCPLSCLWCHNPESVSMSPAVLFRGERCIGCGRCAEACPSGAAGFSLARGGLAAAPPSCRGCGVCEDVCPAAARELCGRKITAEALMAELLKDELFFRDGGGVTFSGGEPLLQPEFLMEALRACGREGFHRAVDTCGFVPGKTLLLAARFTDLFLYDLKCMDADKHKLYTGVDNTLILENLVSLMEAGAKVNIRFPFIPGYTDDDENAAALASFVSKLKGITAVNILPYHTAAKGKHERWNMEYRLPGLLPPTEHRTRRAAGIIEAYGVPVHIGG